MLSVGFFICTFIVMVSIEDIYQKFLACPRVFTDSRLASEGGMFFALKGDKFDGNDFALKAIADGADCAVVDRPVLANSPGCILVEDVLPTLQRLSNYHRKQLGIPFIAITGTNGKTTTKELIANVLSQKYKVLATTGNLNNHIGVPLTLLSIHPEHEIAVIEMGANHPGEIDFLCRIAEPDYGIITNVGKAHLEGFGSFEGVKRTKTELYRYIANHGKGIFINADNEYLMPLAVGNGTKYTYASIDESADLYGIQAGNDVFLVVKVLFEKGWLYLRSNLTGTYNLENILAAARIGLHFGLDPLLIQKGIETYQPSNKRSQILQKNTHTILLDCYNANPSSMEVSIRNFLRIKRPGKIMVLGDMLELGEYAALEHQKVVDMIEQGVCEKVILVGENFMRTKTPDSYIKLNTIDELEPFLENQGEFRNKFILVKGSRRIQLEKLMNWL